MKPVKRLFFRLRVWRDDKLTCDLVVRSDCYYLLCAVRERQESAAKHLGQKLKIVQTSEYCNEN